MSIQDFDNAVPMTQVLEHLERISRPRRAVQVVGHPCIPAYQVRLVCLDHALRIPDCSASEVIENATAFEGYLTGFIKEQK